MTRTSSKWIALTVLLMGAVSMGCGSSDEDSSAQNGDSSGNSNTSTTEATSDSPLVGVWLGVGYLDQELYQAKLATLQDEAQRHEFQLMADSFLTTRLGVSYNPDASYQLEMQIVSTAGEVLGGEAEGTWKVVSVEEDIVVVEQVDLTLGDKKETEYRFVDDNHFALVPPVSEWLIDCNPLIVFERQTDVALDGQSGGDTASGSGSLLR